MNLNILVFEIMTMSTNTNEITNTVSKFQDETSKIYENNIEIQKNIISSYQSVYGRVLENLSKSYWSNSKIPERATEAYNSISKNVLDNITNRTNNKINNNGFVY